MFCVKYRKFCVDVSTIFEKNLENLITQAISIFLQNVIGQAYSSKTIVIVYINVFGKYQSTSIL